MQLHATLSATHDSKNGQDNDDPNDHCIESHEECDDEASSEQCGDWSVNAHLKKSG
jgi:hypothetical protein